MAPMFFRKSAKSSLVPVMRLPLNEQGRDYVFGDVHGEFNLLRQALSELNFDANKDRLIATGDLIDRGSSSEEALDWLYQPWFYSVLGNHEYMLLESERDTNMLMWWTSLNGGGWWLHQGREKRQEFVSVVKQLPIALEIATAEGPVGLVHADLPLDVPWNTFLDQLQRGNKEYRDCALWSRVRMQRMATAPVDGVLRVFCGHTPVQDTLIMDNVYFIDTGACYGRALTVMNIADPEDKVVIQKSSQ